MEILGSLNVSGSSVYYSSITVNNINFGNGSPIYSIRTNQTSVDFGSVTASNFNTYIEVLDTGITSNSIIICNVSCDPTVDHTSDEVMVSNVNAYPSNITGGTGYGIFSYAQNNAWGLYKINSIIIN